MDTKTVTLRAFVLARLDEDDAFAAMMGEPVAAWRRRLREPATRLFPTALLRHLAAFHADHADYDESWRP